jgi:hypothetical protein
MNIFTSHRELMDKVEAFITSHPEQYPSGYPKLTLTDYQKKETARLVQSIRASNPGYDGLFLDLEEKISEATLNVFAIPLMLLLCLWAAVSGQPRYWD